MQHFPVAANLSRGPKPASWRDLVADNPKFRYVLNLESKPYLLEADGYDSGCASDYSITEYTCNLRGWGPPPVRMILRGIVTVEERRKQGPVFVHCADGKTLTGYFFAAYRIVVDGWTRQKAVQEMRAMGFSRFPNFLWEQSLRSFEGLRRSK